jgi:hypothetical protein
MAGNNALTKELSDRDFIRLEVLGDTYRLLRKFKRLRFLGKLQADPVGALSMAFYPEDWERLADTDMDDSDLEVVINAVSEALVGSPKN